jgi:glycosyltransferase involved in cell wall biosynthesis
MPDQLPSHRRILHTEWSLGWGGQEIRILREMEAFRTRGWDMRLACREESIISKRAQESGFPVAHLPFKSSIHLPSVLDLVRIIRRDGISLVHTHSSVDGWLGGMAAKLAGVPMIRSRHLSSPVRAGLNAKLVYDILPEAVISSGRHIRDHLVQEGRCHPSRQYSVPAGADTTLFHPDVETQGLRASLGLKDSDQVIGIVAVLRSWKGHDVLLDAFTSLMKDMPQARLLIVGEGPRRPALEKRIRTGQLEKHVIMTGHRTDVANLMRIMDVCVLPSLKNEATSQVLPQAMLVGTPVVSSSAGGLTEVVEDGIRGRVVPPQDASTLEQALRAVFAEPEKTQKMAAQAREHALIELTFATQIDRTEAVYRKVLGLS